MAVCIAHSLLPWQGRVWTVVLVITNLSLLCLCLTMTCIRVIVCWYGGNSPDLMSLIWVADSLCYLTTKQYLCDRSNLYFQQQCRRVPIASILVNTWQSRLFILDVLACVCVSTLTFFFLQNCLDSSFISILIHNRSA